MKNKVAGIGAIIQDALKAAEAAKDANYIRVAWTKSMSTFTTHVDGRDIAWIELNVQQLDELIRLAQQARSEMS